MYARRISAFWCVLVQSGTPYDKEPVHGICMYHNEIQEKTVQDITNFLHSKFGGKILYRQTRALSYRVQKNLLTQNPLAF